MTGERSGSSSGSGGSSVGSSSCSSSVGSSSSSSSSEDSSSSSTLSGSSAYDRRSGSGGSQRLLLLTASPPILSSLLHRNLDLIAVPKLSSRDSEIFLNNGDGSFSKLGTATTLVAITYGYRASWGDLDGDGLVDLLIVTDDTRSNKLYRNLGSGGFEEWSGSAIMGEASHYKTNAAVFADYNGDGHIDVFMATDTINVLWRNTGTGGGLVKVAGAPFTEGESTHSRDAAFGDYDGDGDLGERACFRPDLSSFMLLVFGLLSSFMRRASGRLACSPTCNAFSSAVLLPHLTYLGLLALLALPRARSVFVH